MVIISGASSGIGKYLYQEFSKKNLAVIGIYNSTEIEECLTNGRYYKVDISDISQVKNFIKQNKNDFNEITLINCAGINYNSFAHKSDLNLWKKVIDVNLFGTFNIISALLPIMREQSFGRIINFGSVVSELSSPGISAYAASKSALFGMTKSIAIENAAKGITINNINLGYSELGMISEVPKKYLDEMIKKIPNGKLCSAKDILNTVQYIIDTEYLTGTNINLNGGLI